MNIVKIDYTLKHKSLDIYFSGCKGVDGKHCKNCHNPQSWDFNQGKNYKEYYDYIRKQVLDNDNLIDNIMLFGGEPMDQPYHELIDFLEFLYNSGKKIWMFTRLSEYEMWLIDTKITNFLHYIKCGCYDEKLIVNDNIQQGIKLATSNQNIYKLN